VTQPLSAWKQVACGHVHTAALALDGRVFSWGSARHGLMGDAAPPDAQVAAGCGAARTRPAVLPVPVEACNALLTGACCCPRKVVCGLMHTAVLLSDGRVITWGSNKHGQCGRAPPVDAAPAAAPLPPGFADTLGTRASEPRAVDISSGWSHVVALCRAEDDRLAAYSWGRHDFGQLGRGVARDAQPAHAPAPMPLPEGAAGDIIKVACGSEHTIVVTRGGSVFACGWSEHGNLGTGDTSPRRRLTPPPLPAPMPPSGGPAARGDAPAVLDAAAGGAASFLLARSAPP
jgi:alpha-tubulin suppressor-like RCC1 family protein